MLAARNTPYMLVAQGKDASKLRAKVQAWAKRRSVFADDASKLGTKADLQHAEQDAGCTRKARLANKPVMDS